jgi:hypothetical protein
MLNVGIAAPRRDLIAAIGGSDLSLPAVVTAMVGSESAWEGAVAFCEAVMLAKETAERERERTSIPLSSRSRRTWRRRAQTDLRPPWEVACERLTWGSQPPDQIQARVGGDVSCVATRREEERDPAM